MQPVCRLSQRGQFGRGAGELRTYVVIAAETLLLDAHIALFVAVIDAWHAADRHEHRQCQRRLGRANLRCDTRHVMVADERLRHEGIQERVVPLQVPIQLEEVLRLQRMLDRLP